jgi:hypothetical protein
MSKVTGTAARPRRFRLDIVGAIEDQPRLIRAYGRAHGAEVALVMRAREGRALLVHVTRDGASIWSSTDAKAGDAPRMPASATRAAEAVALVTAEQKGVPAAGPTTLRGQWSGYLHCDGEHPSVELTRRLAAYGQLTIVSDAREGRWRWTFTRTDKWFSKRGDLRSEETLPTLSQAIEAGVLGAMRLVREACSFRDTRRRAAHDVTYAERHPIKAPKPRKDPTEKLGQAKPPRARRSRKVEPAVTQDASCSCDTKPSAKSAKRKSPSTPRTRTKKAPVSSARTDATKDKALREAFAAAVSQALGTEEIAA